MEEVMNKTQQIGHICRSLLAALVLVAGTCSVSVAASDYVLSKGQTLYVSVYSNIYSSPKKIPFNLAAILSIRNTDIHNPVQIISADYYDTKGRLIRKYYTRPVTLAPLESTYIYVPEEDVVGGIGANFIVKWSAAKEINVPIIECVMIGMKGGQGISFVSPGQVIKENTRRRKTVTRLTTVMR